MSPLVAQIHERVDQPPKAVLVDGGFATHEDSDTVRAPSTGGKVYAPVPKPKDDPKDRSAPPPQDRAAVAEWRQRMATEEAQPIYQERAAPAECVNAQARPRGLRQLRVRGLAKGKAVAVWVALAHNLRRGVSLRAAVAAQE